MFYSITEKLKKKIYGRLERTLFGEREVKREVQESPDRGSKKSNGSMVSGSDEKKIPDPWFN